MADISFEIEQIARAIEGSDVRQAILNGLNAINNQTNDATGILNKWFNPASSKYSGMDVANIQKNIVSLQNSYSGGLNLFSNANCKNGFKFSDANFNGGFQTDEKLLAGRTYTLTALIDGWGSNQFKMSCYSYNNTSAIAQSSMSEIATDGHLNILTITFKATCNWFYNLGLYALDSKQKVLLWYSLVESNAPNSWIPSCKELNKVEDYNLNNLFNYRKPIIFNKDYNTVSFNDSDVNNSIITITAPKMWDARCDFNSYLPPDFSFERYNNTNINFTIAIDVRTSNNFPEGGVFYLAIDNYKIQSKLTPIPDTNGSWTRISATISMNKILQGYDISFILSNANNSTADFTGHYIQVRNIDFHFGKIDLGFTLNNSELLGFIEKQSNIPMQLNSLGNSTANLAITSLKTNMQVENLGKSSVNTMLENIKLKKENTLLNTKLDSIGKQLVQLQLKIFKSEVK